MSSPGEDSRHTTPAGASARVEVRPTPSASPSPPTLGAVEERPSKRLVPRFTMLRARLAALLVLIVAFSIQSPVFFTATNVFNVMLNMSVIGIIALPMTLLLVVRQIDLSVGSALGFGAACFAVVVTTSGGVFGAIVAAFAAVMLVAVINAFAITKLHVNSLITTLATLAIFRGVMKLILDGKSITIPDFGFLGTTRLAIGALAIPVPVIVFAIVFVFFSFLMRFTLYGRHMYAIGSNPRASRLGGLRLERGVVIAYALTGVCVGIATLIQVSKLGSVGPTMGSGLELIAITGVILGGASLAGGRGTVSGTLVAIAILAVLDNGLVLMGISSFWQEVFRGSMLLGAVLFDQVRIRRSRNQSEWEL